MTTTELQRGRRMSFQMFRCGLAYDLTSIADRLNPCKCILNVCLCAFDVRILPSFSRQLYFAQVVGGVIVLTERDTLIGQGSLRENPNARVVLWMSNRCMRLSANARPS